MLTLVFSGDVRFCRPPSGPRPEQLQFDPAILEFIAQSDYRIFNIEGPFTDTAPPANKKDFPLGSPTEFASVLERLHCNVFNLANNHAFDYGLQGFRDTVTTARRRGWQCLGAGENLDEASLPLIFRKEDVGVGLVSVCHREGPVAGPNTPGVFCHDRADLIRQRIQEIKKQCDFAGVIYHGGEEICRAPIPARRKRLIGYLEAGADFVVAHHAHVVQGYEYVDGKPIFYGLGNFLFGFENRQSPNNFNESILLTLRFNRGQAMEFLAASIFDDRVNHVVRRVENHPAFRPITAESYSAEFCIAARDYVDYWMNCDVAHNNCLARLRHVIGLIRGIGHENKRPQIIACAKQLLKKPFRRI